jgi:hypothetical protein
MTKPTATTNGTTNVLRKGKEAGLLTNRPDLHSGTPG